MAGERHWGWASSPLVPVTAYQSGSEAKEICIAPWIDMLRNMVLVALPDLLP